MCWNTRCFHKNGNVFFFNSRLELKNCHHNHQPDLPQNDFQSTKKTRFAPVNFYSNEELIISLSYEFVYISVNYSKFLSTYLATSIRHYEEHLQLIWQEEMRNLILHLEFIYFIATDSVCIYHITKKRLTMIKTFSLKILLLSITEWSSKISKTNIKMSLKTNKTSLWATETNIKSFRLDTKYYYYYKCILTNNVNNSWMLF